ncbi:hypothetical protein JCM11251_007507 [Rhodosporidiobolus azoricus]
MNPAVSRGSRSSISSLSSSATFSSPPTYSSPLTDLDQEEDDGAFRPTKHLPSFFPPSGLARHTSASPAPSAGSMSTRASSASAASAKPQRKERQTRLQEHLRTVKSSRGISPAAMAQKPQAKQQSQEQETVANGRPKRRAATKVVMQEVATDSEEEDAEEDDDEGRSDAAEHEEEEAEQEPEEKPATRRGGRRSVPTPKRAAAAAASTATEDLAPVVSKATPSSLSSRKSPAKATPSKKSPAKKPTTGSKQPPKSNPRQREISNLSIDVDGMNDVQVEARLMREKDELMQRLAQHGIIPQADILDRALRSMTDSNEKLTVESFLRTLSSLNTAGEGGVQPLPLPPAPLALQISPSPPAHHSNSKRVTFSTLESPSTPSATDHPGFAFPSPPAHQQAHLSGAPVALLPPSAASGSLLPSPPGFVGHGGIEPSLAGQQGRHQHPHQGGQQQQQHAYPNPAQLRATRLAAFASNRSHSAPVVPTLALPTPPAAASSPAPAPGQSLFAAQINGMGRVALTRRNPFGGSQASPPQPQAVYQQPHHSLPLPDPSVYQQQPRSALPAHAQQQRAPRPSPASSLLPAFGSGAPSLSGLPKRPRAAPSAAAGAAGGNDDRLAKLKSWLDDDDDTTEDEDAGLSNGKKDAAAELTLKAKAGLVASSLSSTSLAGEKRRLEPAMKLVDAPGSDEEEEGMEIRVGGKSVTILRKSHKRQLEEDEAAAAASAVEPKPIVTPVKQKSSIPTTTRSTRSKGKQKAASECLCGEKVVVEEAEGEDSTTKRCSECDVVFHVACLNVPSPHVLPGGWACERCSGVDAAALIDRPSTPPSVPLSAKRVRIGTTSTPIFPGQEPTFVLSSTFSPAPRRNNDFSDCADMALAPSPTASPVRQFATVSAAMTVPTSPVPSKVSIPVTPQYGEAALLRSGGGSGGGYTGDYSPHSPLTQRQRRARVASNGGGAFSEFLNGGWDGLDAPTGSAHHGSDDYHLQALGHALPAWSDVTMTPSRALASSSSGIGMTPHSGGTHASSSSALWDSPFAAGGGHHRRPSFTLSGGHLRTPSNLAGDIFSFHNHHHQSPSHSAAPSRLFSSANHHDSHSPMQQDPFAPAGLAASPSLRPTSPLNPRRAPPGSHAGTNYHRRTSSTLGGSAAAMQNGSRLAGPWSPTPSHAHAHSHMQGGSWLHERRPSPAGPGMGVGSVGMKVSHSMPGLRSYGTGSAGPSSLAGLSAGFEGLDDIAF